MSTASLGDTPRQGVSLPPMVQHLSATALSMFRTCPEQYRLRYIQRKKERPGAAAVLGSAVWDAQVLGNYEQKIKSGADVAATDIEAAYVHTWDSAVAEDGGADEIKWGGKDMPDDAEGTRMLGLKMAQAYHKTLAPHIQPEAVEQPFEFYVPGVNVPLFGFIDLLEKDGGPIHETKTAKAKVSTPKPKWRLQGRIYQLRENRPIHWDVVTRTKRDTRIWSPTASTHLKPEDAAVELSIEPSEFANRVTERMVKQTAERIAFLWQMYGPDELWPLDGIAHDWACSYCAWREGCPGWSAR